MKYGKIKKYYYENKYFNEVYEIMENLGFKPTKEIEVKGTNAIFKNENDGKYYIFWKVTNDGLDGLLYEIQMKEVLI